MEKKISKLADIDYKNNDLILFNATVIDILNEGDGEKKPMKFVLKLEDSGESVQVSSWKYDLLPILKILVKTDDVYEFKGQAGNYGNYGDQLRIGAAKQLQLKSVRKIIKETDIDRIKAEMESIISMYIPNDSSL